MTFAVRKILDRHNLAPKKKLGQNFLVNSQTAAKIAHVCDIGPEDTIIELGVGLGALTGHLAGRCRRLIGLEIDRGIVAWHEAEKDLPANVELVHEDMLQTDFAWLAQEAGGRLKCVANLPYSISTPLLIKLFDHRQVVDWAVLMLQKEVGERLTAPVGSKEYSSLTLQAAACARTRTLMTLGPGQFHPRPKVDSVVVELLFTPMANGDGEGYDWRKFRLLVRGAFGQRRKTLLNALAAANLGGMGKMEVGRLLDAAGISPRLRAEKLALADFIHLTRMWEQLS